MAPISHNALSTNTTDRTVRYAAIMYVLYVLSLTCSDHVSSGVYVWSVLYALTHPFYVISDDTGRRDKRRRGRVKRGKRWRWTGEERDK